MNEDIRCAVSSLAEDERAAPRRIYSREPWVGEFDPLSGVILHKVGELGALVAE